MTTDITLSTSFIKESYRILILYSIGKISLVWGSLNFPNKETAIPNRCYLAVNGEKNKIKTNNIAWTKNSRQAEFSFGSSKEKTVGSEALSSDERVREQKPNRFANWAPRTNSGLIGRSIYFLCNPMYFMLFLKKIYYLEKWFINFKRGL